MTIISVMPRVSAKAGCDIRDTSSLPITKTCMKHNKMIPSRLFSFFILLALVGLLFPSLLIPIWVLKNKQVEKEVVSVTNKYHQELWYVIQHATSSLLPLSSSATNLAKVATLSLDKTDLTYAEIEPKVAPILFQALLTIPHVSQISYIRKDGLLFSLCSRSHKQIFSIYSNTSFTNATKSREDYSWFVQPVDSDTGKLYGNATMFPPRLLVNETWFQQAMNTTNGFASLGNSWDDDNNLLVLNSARVDKNGVISLGFEFKELKILFSSIKHFGGGLYLATKDGMVMREEIPNTRVVFNRNTTISFQLLKADGDVNRTLQLNYETQQAYIFKVSGTNYILYSSSLDIMGMQSVYLLALPYDGLQIRMHEDIIFVLVILLVMFVTVAIFVFNLVVLTVRAARKEMCLKAALIKQKEATRQAEIKSINQSLAFVTASHDIRASLAGITGLLEMSINQVPQGSELAENLRLVQMCSQDLYSILNSILDTSKIEAGKMQLEEKEFDLEKVVEGVVDLFYPVGLKKKVDVSLDLQDGSLTKFSQVKGDERRFKQILSNLLSNAIKFTSEGDVTVRARARKPRMPCTTHDQPTRCLTNFFLRKSEKFGNLEAVDGDPNCMEFVFEVNDTGKGIPKEKQASIFENYVQVNEADPELEGTGLGLGIVRSLVRLMGGEISIVDKKVGEKGTCFRFNVVFKVLHGINEDDKTPSHGNLSSGSSTPFSSPKPQDYNSPIVILFISGDERRRITQRFLRAHRIQVLPVNNVEQLSETLHRFTHQQQSSCSSRPSLGYLTWHTSNTSPKGVPLSAMDGTDVSPTQRTNPRMVLVVIDTTRADFGELSKEMAEFRKHSKNAWFRVVWLGSQLHEKQLPPSDIIIPMPLHGSRLYSLINLLPEFGGMIPSTPPRGNQRRHTPTRQDEIQESSSRSPLRGKKVLLAEDNIGQQTIGKKMLEKHGFIVETCTNGEKALTLVSQGLSDQRSNALPYEYILMDCQMPVMDGCEATKRIRLKEKDYGVHIPIIGLTAHEEGEELNKMFAAGIDVHVSKPLNQCKLLKVIEDLQSIK